MLKYEKYSKYKLFFSLSSEGRFLYYLFSIDGLLLEKEKEMLQVGIVFFVFATIVLVPFIRALRRANYLADVKCVLRLRIGDIRDCKNGMVNVKLKPFYEGYYVVIEKAEEGKSRLLACGKDNSIIKMELKNDSIFIEKGSVPTLYTFKVRKKGSRPYRDVCVVFLPDREQVWRIEKSIIEEANKKG